MGREGGIKMIHFSKIFLNIWLSIFLLISIPYIIFALIYFPKRGFATTKTCCLNIIWIPLIYGISMFIMSVIGLITSFGKIKLLQSIFNLILNILILFTLCITLYTLFAFPRFPAPVAWATVYNNSVPLADVYPPLMLETLVNDGKWSHVEQCLDRVHLCDSVHSGSVSLDKRTELVYGLLIKGCCYPPNRCELVKKNSSEYEWEVPRGMKSAFSNDGECQKWTRIWDGKCHDCETCKASYVAKFHGGWNALSNFHFFFMSFLLVVTIFTGCGAFSEADSNYNHQ